MFPPRVKDEDEPALGSTRIYFNQPGIQDIRAAGFTCVDMHVHTVYSDSRISVGALLKRAQELGIGVAITDHNEIGGVLEAYKTIPPVPVIPGIEVSAADGPHILLYFRTIPALADFYELHVKPHRRESPFMAIHLTTEEILARAGECDCLKVAAHPYGYSVINRGVLKCVDKHLLPRELPGSLDAIEVICGGMTRALNQRAIAFAEWERCGITGGSDAHCLAAVGSVVTCCHSSTTEEFLRDIQNQHNCVAGTGISSFTKGVTACIIAGKYVPYTIPSLVIHYEQNVVRFRKFVCRWRR
ncbi:MAG: PHP domain-containing protein [Methanoregula sp.]|nr:PHP domain-containing protein [Methanoregula sp.]